MALRASITRFAVGCRAKRFRYGGKLLSETLNICGRQIGFDVFAPIFALVFAPVDLRALKVAQRCLLDVFAFVQSITVGLDVTVCLGGLPRASAISCSVYKARAPGCCDTFCTSSVGSRSDHRPRCDPIYGSRQRQSRCLYGIFAVIQSGLDGKANTLRIIAVHMDNRAETIFAISVQCTVERVSRISEVVKPI